MTPTPATPHVFDSVRAALTSLGLTAYGLSPCDAGVGLVVPWTRTQFAVVSMGHDGVGPVNVVRGVAKDVSRHHDALVRMCREHNDEQPADPVVVHRGAGPDAGWDVLAVNRFEPAALVEAPALVEHYLGDSSVLLGRVHARLTRARLAFNQFAWAPDDLRRLLVRSLV